MSAKIRIKSEKRIQTLGEEIANAISHGVGTFFSIVGTVVLIAYALINSDLTGVISATLFGFSLILLYTCSTLYHSLTNEKAKKVFRILDHCSIFILIFGTYIPVSLSLLRGPVGWFLFFINLSCAALGIVFNSIDLKKFSKVSLFLYLIMGWSVLMTAYPVFKKLSFEGLMLVLIGGLFYTFGVLFYKSKKSYMHFVWHIFVLIGSITHYFFIMFHCL